MAAVPIYRLYMLRAYYALIAFGSMAVFWPSLISHSDEWGVAHGAQFALLGALSPLFVVGLRYPLKMLPLIIYEFVWKCLWFVFVAGPLWMHGHMTEGVWSNVFACSISVVLTPIIVPWPYLWKTYFIAPMDRWTSRGAAEALHN